MQREIPQSKLILFVLTIFLMNMTVMGDMVLIPAINGLYENYFEKINLVNYIVSGPALISVIVSLLTGTLMRYFSKKILLIVGMVLFAVGSISGIAIQDPAYMAVMRTLVGASMGMVGVASVALLSEVFVDEKKRSQVLGLNTAAMSIVGALLGVVAGFAATTAWQSVFRIYWIALPVLLMALFFLPKTPAEGANSDSTADAASKAGIPWGAFALVVLSCLIFHAVYGLVYYQISVYVAENALGDESLAGIYSALGTIGCLVGGIAMGYIYPKIKASAVLLGYLTMVLGLLLLIVWKSVLGVTVSTTLLGIAYGLGFTFFCMHPTVTVPAGRVSTAISIVMAAVSFGMFISTFMVTWLKSALKVETITAIIPAALVILAVGGLLSIVTWFQQRQRAVPQPQPRLN